MSNRDRILTASQELFNSAGTVKVTTNHIARHLKISPGNLYFHFASREEIVRELFERLSTSVYAVWNPQNQLRPRELLESSFEVFWDYRFFHREMYHLRRQDPELARLWHLHLNRCYRLLRLNYVAWVKQGCLRRFRDPWEMKIVSDMVLLSSNAFLGFFESPAKPASRKVLHDGIEYANRLLAPYFTEEYRNGRI